MYLQWTLDPSGILLDVTHSRRTTQKRQTKKILDMANLRGTTTHVARTSKSTRIWHIINYNYSTKANLSRASDSLWRSARTKGKQSKNQSCNLFLWWLFDLINSLDVTLQKYCRTYPKTSSHEGREFWCPITNHSRVHPSCFNYVVTNMHDPRSFFQCYLRSIAREAWKGDPNPDFLYRQLSK